MKSLFKVLTITSLLGFSSLSIAQFKCNSANLLIARTAEEENARNQWEKEHCEWQDICRNISYAEKEFKVCSPTLVKKTNIDKNDSMHFSD
ncbi:hypothetical protein QE177_10965 [Arsenophonus sp. aPb]|uniref:hypothetical protein n=1 Tax=Arsenophonus sp. aPb TaxID=3041619 RepID=UPI00246948B1|nr:hypothetical protein [Arsenophonus sp. aPb]WGL97719.1 hypothetical protein QE177_10965 [Arsenophonus sp. aPb]